MTFYQRLQLAWQTSNSLLCVGIDPDMSRLPQDCLASPQLYFAFSRWIMDQVAPHVSAFKFQFAHFASQGKEDELVASIAYAKQNHPAKLVILDAKRGDIDSTAAHYAEEAFKRYAADAVTLNPYLGYDSVAAFAQHREKGCIYLCRTSNKGAVDFQDLPIQQGLTDGDGPTVTLYEHIAQHIASHWNRDNAVLVMGATQPRALKTIRQRFPHIPFLIPGIGAQGGNLSTVLDASLTKAGNGILISSSRDIIYASNPSEAAQARNEQINDYRQEWVGR